MTRRYGEELQNLSATYKVARAADVTALRNAIAGASQSSLIGVGSGGSFTVASLLCSFHEAFTGHISRPSTPLEIISNPTLAANSPAVFVSAEGKNPDIVEALIRARRHSARQVHVLTNRRDSPLLAAAASLPNVGTHTFELAEKDGYLATNSLLMDAVLVARAYEQLGRPVSVLPPTLNDLQIGTASVEKWIEAARNFVRDASSRRGLIVVYSPSLRAVAADIESKLGESALLYCQLADLRSFAHGRHIWFAERPDDCSVLALTDRALSRLWEFTAAQLPDNVPRLELRAGDGHPAHQIAALVAELHLIDLIAIEKGKDPGRPPGRDFGRALYYAQLNELVPPPIEIEDHGIQEKLDVLGIRWPYGAYRGPIIRARDSFVESLSKQSFRALVFDYDATLSPARHPELPISTDISTRLNELLEKNVRIAIVSGRGRSMREGLRSAIDSKNWAKLVTGIYSGGWISPLSSDETPAVRTSEFLNHVSRIVRGLKEIGVPIAQIEPRPPYQVSVRFLDGVDTVEMWFVIADSLKRAGLDLGTVVRSRHSIDVLEPGVSKSSVVANLVGQYQVLPYEVLAIGDQGAWPGNDAALLEHRFSLSVDYSSRRLDRGWKLAPQHKRGPEATMWYLDRLLFDPSGTISLQLSA